MTRSTYAAVVLALSLAAVPAVRLIDTNSRPLKYGPESQAWVSGSAIDFLATPTSISHSPRSRFANRFLEITIFAFPAPSKFKYPVADSLFAQIK
ncbi:hypothetical protein BOTBODRAFT_188460 [Botryobasidium botryosum FD-172 SS1]|uniref:Uncharacterized protein n=1 Tax=Botryobasidium botryosum (strain FD-172 SS1) TaxID=930990 RepID=A0A067MD37_BOTB1|nr:hypothetical protein BOTBODRAFT_188460 [Botryobasidium botryosum FD-172 SS1]